MFDVNLSDVDFYNWWNTVIEIKTILISQF